MPITQERETIQDLRSAGFTENQAIVLAAKLEAASQAASQDLKGFLVAELDKRFGELDKRFADVDKRFVDLESRMNVRFEASEGRTNVGFAEMEARMNVGFAQMEARMNVGFAQLEARFEKSLRLQLAAILTAIVGVTGLAVAIIKLFPNAH
jgi:hypothetical protein